MEKKDSTKSVGNINQSIVEFVSLLYSKRRLIIVNVTIFALLGVIIGLISPKVYTASTTMIPQSAGDESNVGSKGLSGLASIAGINLGGLSGNSGISPVLYPKILNGVPFQQELINSELDGVIINNEPVTFKRYYTEIYEPSILSLIQKYTIGLPGVILGSGSAGTDSTGRENSDLLALSQEDVKLTKKLSGQVALEINQEIGYLTLTVKMPEPKLAAAFAIKVQELLQKEIIDLKIKKAQDQLTFLEDRLSVKKAEFDSIQYELAQFLDRNSNTTSETAKIKVKKLQYDFDLAYNIYSELASNVESQEIQVKETTPVFTVIEPVIVPYKRSAPRSVLIIFICMVLGLVFSITYVFIKQFLEVLQIDIRLFKKRPKNA